ncbi:M24 family metallopeptidase [Streptomyces armeniacus]|uniref:M24 family metallopeptidase n=1 Tax=Streptomyces armeniacus TaxID=83291 RepID=A0A345XPE8_9ACTN|nr:M24 family metallopeptidase [Streptomyces armeniacus]AXK33514.1 M24 family metallopeptidase [Streptomyces armeniacus]
MSAAFPGAPDFPEKRDRLCELAARHGLDALVLREPATLAWLLGARVHVPQTLDSACFTVLLTAATGELAVAANAIEAPRLRDTELAGLAADWRTVPWWENRDAGLPTGPRTGSDRPGPHDVPLAAEIARVRRVLTGHQQELLAEVARDTAEAATDTAYGLAPGRTERQAAAALAHALLDRGLDPVVLLAAADERIALHRHPLPTDRAATGRLMLVACARRHGLIASITRTVSFGAPSEAGRRDYARLLEVERAFLDASLPGARLGDVFGAGVAAYAANGLPADEWHRHHQGGFSGTQPREFPAHHTSEELLPEGGVVAWNPSGGGWKTEDTALVRAEGVRTLVHDPRWPAVPCGGRDRPDILTL